MHHPIRVLFLCTGNSARSQMAEGFLRHEGGSDFEVDSAGTNPTTLNPLALKVMAENGIDIFQQQSKHVDTLKDKTFDFVITVCDNARDNCPTFFNESGEKLQTFHWGYPDPAAVEGDEETRLRAFRNVAIALRERIRLLVTVDRKQLREEGLK
jgi:arsenate reductase